MSGPWEKFQSAEQGPWGKYGTSPEQSLDYSKPIQELRKDIDALSPTDQEKAYRLYAKQYVQKERAAGFRPLPQAERGIPLIGGLLDEASAAIESVPNWVSRAVKTIQPGVPEIGGRYDENLAIQRERATQSEAANPALAVGSQLAAGIATAAPLARILPTGGGTTLGRVAAGVPVGAGLGYVEGYTRGEGIKDRNEAGGRGALVGGAVGGVLPVATDLAARGYGAAVDAISPTILARRFGPEAAADDILARRIAAEGATPAQKRLDLQRGQAQSARLDSNSYATLPESIADTSDAMRRLTGSLYRQGGESGNFVRETLDARQRGVDNPFAPRASTEPLGQMERVLDTTERALLIRSADSARQTERQIMTKQAQQGRTLYQQAYQNSEPFDLQPVLDGLALKTQQYPGPFRARLNRALNLFRDNTPQQMPVTNIQRFDASKKALDDMIEKAQRAGEGNLTRELTDFKNELLNAVHRVDNTGAPTANLTYQQARQAWGSAAENREAIELGRAALRENAEVTAEQFRDLTRGQQQLFRLGFLESLRNALSTRKPGNDVTQLFQQRRVQELMNEIIPASRGPNTVFANRPERFGDVLNREQRMVQTRNQALGNSATQQREADDAVFAGDAMAGMWNRFRQSPSLFNMGIEAIGVGIQRVFGYRQDVALALARRLLETNPTARNQILRRLQRRGGPDRFAQFLDLMQQAETRALGSMQPAITESRE